MDFIATQGVHEVLYSELPAIDYFEVTDWVRCEYKPQVEFLDHLGVPITGKISNLVSTESDGRIKIDTQFYDETTKGVGIILRATT